MLKMKNKTLKCNVNEKKLSINDFKNVFTGIMPAASTKQKSNILYATAIDTAVGEMLAIADEEKLYLLEFIDWRKLKQEIWRLRETVNAVIILENTKPLISIKKELKDYFKGKLQLFKTPLYSWGTTFQQQVWKEIQKIPYGRTLSYADVATLVDRPAAYRAVANAAGINQFAVVIPCHRVISHSGGIGGYGTSLDRKKWLLDHEARYSHLCIKD